MRAGPSDAPLPDRRLARGGGIRIHRYDRHRVPFIDAGGAFRESYPDFGDDCASPPVSVCAIIPGSVRSASIPAVPLQKEDGQRGSWHIYGIGQAF